MLSQNVEFSFSSLMCRLSSSSLYFELSNHPFKSDSIHLDEILSDRPSKGRTASQIFKQIYEQQGVRGLFTGTTPRVIRVAPSCAIMISSFEYGKIFFNRLANPHMPKSEGETQSAPARLVQSSASQFSNGNVVTGHSSKREIL